MKTIITPAWMEGGLVSCQIKLLPLAIILLLLQLNVHTAGQPPPTQATTNSPTTVHNVVDGETNNICNTASDANHSVTSTASDGVLVDGEATTTDGHTLKATSEPQDGDNQLPTTEQPSPSHPPFLKGITLTAIVVVSVLGGMTSLIVCVVVSVAITVKIKQRKRRRNRREASTTHAHTVAVNVQRPDFDMTNNTAYHSGPQARASNNDNTNVYVTRPSSRASTTQNNQPEASIFPNSYLQARNNRVDVSVDSLGYVKVPKHHN